MAKNYHFGSQPASDECPAIPRGVVVWGETLHDATTKLAEALGKDPQLAKEHPEFEKKPAKVHNRKRKGSIS